MQGDVNAAQRGDGQKSQEINLPHMQHDRQQEAEETTQTLNTSEKSTALFPGQSAVRWSSHFTHLSYLQQPADTHFSPLPTVQFVFIVNYKERSTSTCRNQAAP